MAQIKDFNERNKNARLSLCLPPTPCSPKSTRPTSCPIRSYRSAPQGEGYLAIFSRLNGRTKPGSVREDYGTRMQPESPFISVKTRGFLRPCSHPGHHPLLHLPAPPLLTPPPAPVAAYLRLLISGLRRPQTGADNIQRLERESTAERSRRAVPLESGQRGRRQTASPFRGIWLSKYNAEPRTKGVLFSLKSTLLPPPPVLPVLPVTST